MKHQILTLALVAFMSFAAKAQTTTQGTDVRRGVQRGRIAEGRATGEVTNGEAGILNRQQRRLARSERRAKADGVVTSREQARLDRKQNRANRSIRQAKHNAITK